MEKICDYFLKTEKYVDKVVVASAGSVIFCSTLLVFVQVIFRYLLEDSLSWSEEMTRYCMIWAVFLACGYVLSRGGHTCLDLDFGNLSPVLKRHLTNISLGLMLLFGVLLIRYGATFVYYGSRQVSSAMQIPMSWVYMAIPVGGGLIIYYCLLMFIKNQRSGRV